MKIEFTKDQLKDLAIFLQRTNLTGMEVPAFLTLVNIINNAQLADEKVSDKVKENKKVS
jgi:hypothetical protein